MKTKHDDGLEWLRKIRREMAAEFAYNPRKMGAHYRQLQNRYKSRLFKRELATVGK